MSAMTMAEKNNKNVEQEDQARVPVLTVLKNNAILKNIFIVLDENQHKQDQTVLIGRHPHCNIVLTHPSVSRFHLRIRSNPSSRALSIVDLGSVHGTWVCGRKLEAKVSVELKEGDTFMVGVSTRVYRLSWVPLTQFNAFVPQQHENDYLQQEIMKDENLELTVEREIPMAEDIVSLCCDEERKSHSENEALGVDNGTQTLCVPANFGGENILCDCQNRVLSPPYVHSVNELDNVLNTEAFPEVEMPEDTNLLCTLREYLKQNICLPVVEAVQGTKMQQFQAPPDTFTGKPFSFEMQQSSLPKNIDAMSFDEKNISAVDVIPTESEFGSTNGDSDMDEDILITGARILNSENMSLVVDEDIPGSKFTQIKVVEEVSVDSVPDRGKQDECKEDYESKLRDLNAKSCCEEDIPRSKFQQIEVVEEVSGDSVPDGGKPDGCMEDYESKLQDLNAKSCCEEDGYSLDEIGKDNGNNCIENMNLASSDENGLAAVTVTTEFEFECTLRDNKRIGHILAKESRVINSENATLLDDEATKFQPIKVIEEVAVDSVSDAEKEDKCSNKLQPSLNAKFCQEQGNSTNEIAEDTASFGAKSSAAVTEIPTEYELGCTLRDNVMIEDILATESRINNYENTSLLDEEATKFQPIKIVEEVAMASISDAEIEDKCGKELQGSLNSKFSQEQGNSADEIAEDTGNRCASNIPFMSFQVESLNSSIPHEAIMSIADKIENQTPQSVTAATGCSGRKIFENHIEPTEKSSSFGSIWSRRGKAASAPQVRSKKSRFMSTSKVDTEVKMSYAKVIINKPMQKDLSSVFNEEEETFTQNKENLSPNTYHMQFMKKKGKLEEIKHSMSKRSPSLDTNISPSTFLSKSISTISNKRSQGPKVAQEWRSQRKPLQCRINLAQEQDVMELKKNRVERVPFQSLMTSGGNHKSVTVSAAKSIDDASICGQISSNCTEPSHISREQKRSWDMVIDTASLLNKESRKALQLLQGLKGTRLIIPRLVMKELDSMKNQLKIFRTTSEASLALKWIEECMEKKKWWIQIQSSMEECRLTAPTPLASPQTQSTENISNECASSTLEYILDCALQYRREENIGQLVLLSDDVTLKIKSMAKGLLCETVQQFRQSLVNPFSERFMWPESSPRGLTWSCQDDVVLKEKYCGLPSKAGLKLIA